MTGNQYLTGLTLYFIGYVIFEVPCNIVLKRASPKIWLPTLTIGWGIVSTLMGVTQNLSGFFAVRFFLGEFSVLIVCDHFARSVCSC
jgi:hypothetical protein